MDKQKQIEEMAKNKEFKKLVRLIENTHPFYVETIAERILEKYQPKILEGAVVLTREEYSDYLVMKNAHQNAIERCEKLQADNERLYKNIGKFKDAVRKETAEKLAKKIQDYLNDKVCEEFGDSACDVTYFTIDVDKVISDVFEIAKEITEGV